MNPLQLSCKKVFWLLWSHFGLVGVRWREFYRRKKVVRIVNAFLLGKQRGANARLGKACLRPNGLI